jgi:hypothetical protein
VLAEPPHLGLGGIERPHEQRAGNRQRLGDDAGELAGARLRLALDRLALLSHTPRAQDEQRHHRDGDKRKPPLQEDHERDRRDQDHRILRDVGQRPAHRVADALDIVEHVADGFAGLELRKRRERDFVEAPIERGPEIEHDILTDRLGEVLLPDAHAFGEEGTGNHADAAQPEETQVAIGKGDVDDALHEPGRGKAEKRRRHHAAPHAQGPQPVWLHALDDPSEDRGVHPWNVAWCNRCLAMQRRRPRVKEQPMCHGDA